MTAVSTMGRATFRLASGIRVSGFTWSAAWRGVPFMAERGRDEEFREFAESRADWLRRVAFLLCSDWHRADDLVQETFAKLYVHWRRMRRAENPDGCSPARTGS
ncbi:sigma factor [Streptomyces sp. PA03-6a]|nr:sigma factor [Streptomyces sp. PA03-6a]